MMTRQMPAVVCGVCVAVCRNLHTARASPAGPINPEMPDGMLFSVCHSTRLHLEGRRAANPTPPRLRDPDAIRAEWDHYEGTGAIPEMQMVVRTRRTAFSVCDERLNKARDAAILDKRGGLVLDLNLRQGKKVCCHVV